jgi:tight adherence protein C
LAGKGRENAFNDMADRTSLDEMRAFSNVILQSKQFGTSVSQALNTYAVEMRMDRELKAQEKANRLPVLMSGIMAALMMLALLLICLTPVIIRMLSVFGDQI